jgi:hypothetical protein
MIVTFVMMKWRITPEIDCQKLRNRTCHPRSPESEIEQKERAETLEEVKNVIKRWKDKETTRRRYPLFGHGSDD